MQILAFIRCASPNCGVLDIGIFIIISLISYQIKCLLACRNNFSNNIINIVLTQYRMCKR